MNRQTADVRSLVGRKVDDAAGRFHDLLAEIRRLRRRTTGFDEKECRERLFLIVGLLSAHGPREDRLLRYQLEEMGRHLRRSSGASLAA